MALKSLFCLNCPSPALTTTLHVNRFPNKVAPSVTNNIPSKPPRCLDQEFYQESLLTVLFWIAEFLIVSYYVMNYLQRLYETFKHVYPLVIIYVEN